MQLSIQQAAMANGATAFDPALPPEFPNAIVMSTAQIESTVKGQIKQLSGPPVGYQRLHPQKGWVNLEQADIGHYEAKGQEIRELFLVASPLMLSYIYSLEQTLTKLINASCAADMPALRAHTSMAIECLDDKPECLK